MLGRMTESGNGMRSGELARLAGVSTDTLRHYERLGVLASPGRTTSGYRVYQAAALQRVLLIRRALAVGFSLPELARILRVRDAGGAPCKQVRAMAECNLGEIDRRIEEMLLLRKQLAELLAAWDERLDGTPSGQRAGLLEMLSGPPPSSSRKGLQRTSPRRHGEH